MKTLLLALLLFAQTHSLITSGSYTVGVGGDYATLKDVHTANADSGLTGDMTLTVVSSFTDTPTVWKCALNGYTLRFTSNKHHYGLLDSGNIITYSNTNNAYAFEIQGKPGTAGTYIIENLNFKKTGSSSNENYSIIQVNNFGSSAAHTFYLRNCILNRNNISGQCFGQNNASIVTKISNCAMVYTFGSTAKAINLYSVPATSVIENVLIYYILFAA
jgi:hypothetical protein